MDLFEVLKSRDGLRELVFEDIDCFIHEDHRWVLPLIHHQQQTGKLPTPCTLISFDMHHDSCAPDSDAKEQIRRIRANGVSEQNLVDLCERFLCAVDDDWIQAGMELGLIDNAVLFGVHDPGRFEVSNTIVDHRDTEHVIRLESTWLNDALGDRGALGDIARPDLYRQLWDILHWHYKPRIGFCFDEEAPTIALDFDLDHFCMIWERYTFAWPDIVFQDAFLKPSASPYTKGWSGKSFIEALLSQAGMLTIAREPRCCGGDEIADEILQKVNDFLFDGKLCI